MDNRFIARFLKWFPFTVGMLLVISALSETILNFKAIESLLFEKNQNTVVIIGVTIMLTTIFFQIIYTFNTNPISISLSLLGFPRVGKTVYLTMLFEELQKSKDSYINFAPYGNETIEKVLLDVNTLRNGKWLPSTGFNSVFSYRAYANLNSNFLGLKKKKKFKIEFADYAGEHIDEFNSQKENWLHKTEYFNYVLQSDGIFLALDVGKYYEDEESYEMDMDGLIAAVQILAEHKGAINGEKSSVPISIIFLKSDLINFDKHAQKILLNKTARLISICTNRFEEVESFFVSSTGQLSNGELHGVSPVKVVEPLLWLLKRSRIR